MRGHEQVQVLVCVNEWMFVWTVWECVSIRHVCFMRGQIGGRVYERGDGIPPSCRLQQWRR